MFKFISVLSALFFVGCYNGYTENYTQVKDITTKPIKNEYSFVENYDLNDTLKNGYSLVGYSNFRYQWSDWKYDCRLSGETMNSEITICLEPKFVRSFDYTYNTTRTVTYKENTDVNIYGDVRIWGNSTTTGTIEVPTEKTIKIYVYEYKALYLKRQKYIFGVVPEYFDNSEISIKYVIKDSPAERQGLTYNDTILELNGTKITNLQEFNDFEKMHHDSIVTIKIKNNSIKTVYIKFD